MNVAAAICEQVAAWDVSHVFGVSGANIELIFEAAARHARLEPVVAKHEAAAAMMSIGYQERSGRLGVVLTTSGGGAFNIVAPLTEALASRVPILALVGQSPAGRDGTGAFQDSSGRDTRVDAEQVFRTLSVSCTRVIEPSDAVDAVWRAAAAAIELDGPAVVLLPRDVQAAELGTPDLADLPLPVHAARPALGPEVGRVVADAVAEAVPPLIIAGAGVVTSRSSAALVRLARRWGSPIAVTPEAKSVIASASPYALGVTGVMGHPAVVEYARRASTCVLFGTRLPDVARYGLDDPLAAMTIVNVNPEPCFPALTGHPGVLDVTEEIPATIDALTAEARVPDGPFWFPRALEPVARHVDDHSAPGELSSARVMERLGQRIEPGSDVFADAGNAGAFAVHHLPMDGIGDFSVALGMGAMGHAFGASIGAAAHTRRRTYVIAGDGSFYMHGLEVHTALEYDLPITYIVLNNNAHAMCRLREENLLDGETELNTFAPAALARGVAAMFPGLAAFEVGCVDDLDAALAAVEQHGPAFVSVTVPADEEPPFWPLASRQRQRVEVHA